LPAPGVHPVVGTATGGEVSRSAAGKIAVVTGANRGMGLETCRQLARLGARVVLTSRDAARGEAAAGQLRADGLEVRQHPLDIADDASIGRLAGFVERELGRLDILINNAAIVRGVDETREQAAGTFEATPSGFRAVLATNLIGPFVLCRTLLSLMRGSGRVVNLSSGLGQLSDMGGGFPAYRVSKAGLNALTRIFASELRGTGIKVNAVCPGWVRTDMGGPNAARSVEQGVVTTIWLATLPDDGPSGGLFRDRRPIPW
jgi:NAD(P)-dependent dehydrogenase (short-subunit alcohol dehydrogenase family)